MAGDGRLATTDAVAVLERLGRGNPTVAFKALRITCCQHPRRASSSALKTSSTASWVSFCVRSRLGVQLAEGRGRVIPPVAEHVGNRWNDLGEIFQGN